MLDLARSFRAFLPAPRSSATPGPLDTFWYQPVTPPTATGIVVKPDNALKVGAVFSCIRVLRESLGALPWKVMRRLGGGAVRPAPDYYLWDVLHTRPNRWMTPIEWKEMGVAHICLRGNFYNRIVDQGQGVELWPLNPDFMTVDQLPDRTLKYTYRPHPGKEEHYSASEMLHVRGLSLNSVTGVSVLQYAQNTIGLSIAQQTHGASLFRNGGLPTFWVSRPAGKTWTPDAKRNFREGWRKLHAGPENAGNPPILQDGMELHELGLSNRDSQWLESLNFNAIDICRFFGVMPHQIGIRTDAELDVEQMGLEFVIYTLAPLATRFEQAADRDLILDGEDYFTKYDFDGLLRGNKLVRAQAHNIGIQGGWLTVNEVRAEEGRNPVDGGDTARFPSNMQPAGGGPDWNEQGGQPGKGKKKPPTKAKDEDEDLLIDEDGAGDARSQSSVVSGQSSVAGQRTTDNGQRTAFAILLDDAAARLAAAEIAGLEARASKAAEDRPKFDAWARDFYLRHRLSCRKVLDPIVRAWRSAGGPDPDESDAREAFSAFHGQLFAAADVAATVAGWKETRAPALAALLKGLFFTAA